MKNKNLRDLVHRILWESIPYLVALLAGILLFDFSLVLGNPAFQNLFISIAAIFISIPMLFLFYELGKVVSHRHLTREMFEYAKRLIDGDMINILSRISKQVYPFDVGDIQQIRFKLINANAEKISEILSDSLYLGFQIYKQWYETETNIRRVIESAFSLHVFNDKQIITLIKLINAVDHLERISTSQSVFYIVNQTDSEEFKIASGRDLGPYNQEHPERLILLKKTKTRDQFVVVDFGDFPPNARNDLLKGYKVTQDALPSYAKAISEILEEVRMWQDTTGHKLFLS